MNLCKYGKQLKCEKCGVVHFNKCPNFRRAHNNTLIHELRPFQYQKTDKLPPDRIYFSRNEHKIKSACADYAVRHNKKIKKININQAIDLVISASELEFSIVYVDCNRRLHGDIDKISQVFYSFIDKCSLLGIVPFVFLKTAQIQPFDDWHLV